MSLFRLCSLFLLNILFFLIFPFFNEAFATSSWHVVSSPNLPGSNFLHAVTSASSNDVWAVGYNQNSATNPVTVLPIAIHWNGYEWSNNTTNGYLNSTLIGVSAISSSNILAVGDSVVHGFNTPTTLALHWNGSEWSPIPSDSPGVDAGFTSVNSDSSGNAWAVGITHSILSPYHTHILLEQYQGPTKGFVAYTDPPFDPNEDSDLTAVTVYSSTDAWTVGYACSIGCHPLIYHWDGVKWKNIAVPTPPDTLYGWLYGVTAISSDNVWAVGESGPGRTYIIHWNGTLWSIVPSPSPSPTKSDHLYAIYALNDHEIYAVGYTRGPVDTQYNNTLILKYDGTQWQQVASPNAGNPTNNELHGITGVSSGEMWAVGHYNWDYPPRTLTLHYTPTILNVPLIKQGIIPFDDNNPSWEGEEFDHASQHGGFLCGTTIAQCGCAMTSTAMIFKHYGIEKLPDATPFSPGTFNTWLKNNNGYFRDEGLNPYVAATLARKAKDQNPNFTYDALEYSRVNGTNTTQLTSDLQNGIPDVLEEPGRFIVGTGIDEDTFNINDPFYNRTSLTSYNNSFLSLGRYTRSHSDSSYIVLAVDKDIDISLKDAAGSAVAESYLQYHINNATTTEGAPSSPSLKILAYPKPANGSYQIEVNTSASQKYQLDSYVIDQEGDVGVQTFAGQSVPNITNRFSLSYDKQSTTTSTIKPNITLNILKSDLQKLYDQGFIDNKGIFTSLKAEVELAIKASNIKPQILGNKLTVSALKVFLLELNTQRGKNVKEEAYQVLKNAADYLIKSYQK